MFLLQGFSSNTLNMRGGAAFTFFAPAPRHQSATDIDCLWDYDMQDVL